MRTRPTKEEFVAFCERVSTGKHKEIVKASKVLVECLCKEEDWHEDQHFLAQVSNIPFVLAHRLQRLAWIKPPCSAKNIIQKGKKSFSLTTLRGSVLYSIRNSKIAWTVRSIIELPRLPYSYISIDAQETTCNFLDNIGVSKDPSLAEVIRNLHNLSQTKFADFSLFHTYPAELRPPKHAYPLLEVVHENLLYLKKGDIPSSSLDELRNVPCIPVSQEGSAVVIDKPVLVRPMSVVASHPTQLKQFLPILNPLPDMFFNVHHGLLSEMGIRNEIHLEQVQFALDTIKDYIQEPYDPTTSRIIQRLLPKLYFLLPINTSGTQVSVLKHPLYLPNKSGVLVDSKTLLFDDVGYHRGGFFDLSEVKYSFMSLLVKREQERDEYLFTAKELCSKLPEHVQPHSLSKCTSTTLHENCTPIADEDLNCQLVAKLRKAFKFSQFADVVSKMLKHEGSPSELSSLFCGHLRTFLQQLEVVAVNGLKVSIFLSLVDPPTKIGTAPVDFHLQQEEDGHVLYVSAQVSPLKLNLFENLSKCIADTVTRMSSTDMAGLKDPDRVIGVVLRVEDSNQLQDHLLQLGISSSDMQLEESLDNTDSFQPKVGDPIPDFWHHRLQSDINNYFRPQEMAALEVGEERYIYIRVECKLPADQSETEHKEDSDSEEEEEVVELDRYLIRVSEEEEGTKTVSVIDLFKILSTKEVKRDDGTTEVILYNPDDESVTTWNLVKGDKLKDIMTKICAELRRIWKIKDEDQKRKAIKAMYLKWHPDKNPNPLATKAFQFLQQQIARLKQGLPLEDPRDDWEPQTDQFPDEYQWWDKIARMRTRTWKQERSRPRCSGGGGIPAGWPNISRTCPDPSKAQVWFEQAEHDLTALGLLLEKVDDTPQVSAHVCFLAHQVAEKAVKAGMYQVCGLQPEGLIHHKFIGYAGALEQERSSLSCGLQALTRVLENYYVTTRYPSAYNPPAAPSNKFGPSDAREAGMIARQIFEVIEKIVHE